MKIFTYLYAVLLIHISIHSNTEIIQEVSALEFAQRNPQAKVLQCTKDYPFNFQPYPLYQEYAQKHFPNQGIFRNIYIINAADSTANFCHYPLWGINGLIFINNYFVKECQIKDISPFYLNKTNSLEVHKTSHNYYVNGTLAICSHVYPDCYGHFMLDVLCQLALLELFNIQYDYLCIPYHQKFMQEALELWGIDPKKIIPLTFNITIKAQNIIMPTSVTETQMFASNCNYTIDILIQYVSKKLLDSTLKKKNHLHKNSKIFISRKDAPANKRIVPNEDEIFQLFEDNGFKRYELTKLSLTEQILLFHNAEEIVSFVGSGALNIIFAKPNTKYIEIIQTMLDATFFFLANIFNLNYYYIDATLNNGIKQSHPVSCAKAIDPKIIKNFLKNI
ncbi:glycosyltransferase family 61 protein [Candidatus Dependentiae bacterium]|nr:glycosyltransferase family 61 protein [Candidatus Dependentiae bacterium]